MTSLWFPEGHSLLSLLLSAAVSVLECVRSVAGSLVFLKDIFPSLSLDRIKQNRIKWTGMVSFLLEDFKGH